MGAVHVLTPRCADEAGSWFGFHVHLLVCGPASARSASHACIKTRFCTIQKCCMFVRWGRREAGLFREWSAERPVHLIAYSLGAPTARYLQHLLICKAFCDDDGNEIETSGAWVSTIVTCNGVNNGTVAVHAVGLSRRTLAPVQFSILWWIFTVVYRAPHATTLACVLRTISLPQSRLPDKNTASGHTALQHGSCAH
jgi:hypothetical protein